MSQNQEEIEARLAAYIDGELDAAERAEIEKHLEANPVHKALIKELMGQRDLVKDLPHEKAPAEIFETLQGQLERSVLLGNAGEALDQPMRMSRWPHRGAIAAIILLTAGLGFLVYKVLPSNKPPAEFAVAPKETGPVPATMETDELKSTDGDKPLVVTSVDKSEADKSELHDTEKQLDAGKSIDAGPHDEVMAKKGGLDAVALTTPAPVAAPSVAPAAPGNAPAPDLSINAPPAPIAGEDQSKVAAQPGPQAPAVTGQIAMVPPAASNSVAATEQPLMNAMNKSDAGQGRAFGSMGGGGGGAFQSKFGEQNAAGQMPAGSMYLVCSTDDPSTASEQVKNYLTDNGIAWEQSVAPLQLRQGDYVAMNRFRSQQVQVTQQDQFAKAPYDERYRYVRKDVASDRPAEAEAIAQKPAAEESGDRRANEAAPTAAAPTTTAPTAPVVAFDANTAQAPGAVNAAPSTTQATVENGEALAETNGQPLAYLCRSVTPEQAHELEAVLTSRPGQSVELNPTAPITAPVVAPLSIAPPLNQNSEITPAAPTTQPQASAAAPIAQSTPPADVAATGKNATLDIQQQVAAQQGQPSEQPQQSEQRADLWVVLRRASAASTQPTTSASPAIAPVPVQEPSPKSP